MVLVQFQLLTLVSALFLRAVVVKRSVRVGVPLELMSWGLEILPVLDIAISGFRVLVLCRNLTDG